VWFGEFAVGFRNVIERAPSPGVVPLENSSR
jgi:hypothetical protein